MNKTTFVQFQKFQAEREQERVDEYMDAWRWVTDHWGTVTWRRIDPKVAAILSLPHDLGMCRGVLLTERAAEGQALCIARMNRPRGKEYVR